MNHTAATACLHRLLQQTRVGALSTLGTGGPYGSMVPFVLDPVSGAVYLHLSTLAQHTRNLALDPRVSLLVMAPDLPDQNPLALARATLGGRVQRMAPDDPAHGEAAARYLGRFPTAEQVFQLADFALYRLLAEKIQLVAGFGSTATLPTTALCETGT